MKEFYYDDRMESTILVASAPTESLLLVSLSPIMVANTNQTLPFTELQVARLFPIICSHRLRG